MMVLSDINVPILGYSNRLVAVLSFLLARLRTPAYNYGVRHLIEGFVFNYAPAYAAFKYLAEVDWTPCSTD